MLTEGRAAYAFELLDRTGLLREVLRKIDRMHGVEQPPELHPEGDVWVHTLLLLEKLTSGCAPTLAWSALLHDVGKPPAKAGTVSAPASTATPRWAPVWPRPFAPVSVFSNEDTAQIASLVANHMRFGDVGKMKQSTLKRFLRLPRFPEHLELHRIDCLSSHKFLACMTTPNANTKPPRPRRSAPPCSSPAAT